MAKRDVNAKTACLAKHAMLRQNVKRTAMETENVFVENVCVKLASKVHCVNRNWSARRIQTEESVVVMVNVSMEIAFAMLGGVETGVEIVFCVGKTVMGMEGATTRNVSAL